MAKLTDAHITKLVRRWQRLLRLVDWRIDWQWAKPEGERVDHAGWTVMNRDLRRAVLNISADMDWSRAIVAPPNDISSVLDINLLVGHELAHLVLFDTGWDDVHDGLADLMAPAIWAQAKERLHQLEEALCDRIAAIGDDKWTR